MSEVKTKNYFNELYKIDVNDKKKKKNGLNYLSWAAAWAEVKKMFPDATYEIHEQVIDVREFKEGYEQHRQINRPWFDDGSTGWVKTSVTICGITHTEELPIMNLSNKSIEASKITSADANKSIQRSLTKACARHGLGLYIYEGEDLPEETKDTNNLKAECWKLFCEKAKLSDGAKEKANDFCKIADPSGDPREIDDIDVLKSLKKQLLGIRK